MDISIFEPYYNTITLQGAVRLTAWCNETFLHAQTLLSLLGEREITYTSISNNLDKPTVLYALVYGALKAADESLSLPDFSSLVKPGEVIEAVSDIVDGIKQYSRIIDSVEFGELDEEYPETRQMSEGGGVDFSWWFSALKSAGYSMKEIYRMRMIGMQYAVSLANGLEVETQEDVLKEMGSAED